jgi:hypothetical protein
LEFHGYSTISEIKNLPDSIEYFKINNCALKIFFENIIKKRRSGIKNNYFRLNLFNAKTKAKKL